MFWILIERLSPALALIGILMPFIGLGLGLGWYQRTRDRAGGAPGKAPSAAMGCLGGASIAPILLYFAFCTPPPGEGAAAREAYARGAPVVAALEQFRASTASYPDSLAALVPRWLSDTALRLPSQTDPGQPWGYERTNAGYILSFRYYGPGSNTCTLRSETRAWTCTGLF